MKSAYRPNPKTAERRYDARGEFRLMTEAEGWIMCRRKGCVPFVTRRREWDRLSKVPVDQDGRPMASSDGKVVPLR